MVDAPESVLPRVDPAARPDDHRPVPGTAHGTERHRWLVPVLLGALMASSVLAHDPRRMVTQPLWRDENWVAVTLRAPASQILRLTSTTPVLFTALLRVTPHWTPQSLRILPLAFSAACVLPAWLLGRQLDPGRWLTGAVLAVTAAFAPSLLVRHDLKQYTAEACTTLVTVWLLARLERHWTRHWLVALGAVVALGPLFGNASIFLGPAVVASLGLLLLGRRRFDHLRDLAVVGAAALLADALAFVLVDRPGQTPSLRAYWADLYVPLHAGTADILHFLHYRAVAELQAVGLGPSWVAAALVLLGLVTLVRLGFPALALVVPAVTVEQLVAASAQRYPLFDLRTSTWFTVLLTAVAAVGVCGLLRVALRGARGLAGWQGSAARATAGALVGVLVVALASPVSAAVRTAAATTTPLEDVQGQVRTILEQHRPGDVVVANVDAGFGLGVYWPAPPELVANQARLNTFRVTYPPADRVVVATTISQPAEIAAVRAAVALARPAPGARVWVVLSHWHPLERQTMLATLGQCGTLTTPPHQHGLEPVLLLIIGPGPAAAAGDACG